METLSICWLAGCRQRIVRRVEGGGGHLSADMSVSTILSESEESASFIDRQNGSHSMATFYISLPELHNIKLGIPIIVKHRSHVWSLVRQWVKGEGMVVAPPAGAPC